MENLLVVIAKGLVENKEAVNVTVDQPAEDGTVVYHLHEGASHCNACRCKQNRFQNCS